MSQIMKSFTGIIIIFLMTMVCIGILSLFLKVLSTQELYADMVYRLECSNFAPVIMTECFQSAEQAGDQLTLILYLEDGSSLRCSSAAGLPEENTGIQSAKVLLTYPVECLFPSISRQYVMSGYAR